MFRYKAVHLQRFYDLYVQLKTVRTMAKPSWISLDKSSGTGRSSVEVTAAGNSSTSSRSGTLTVKTSSGLTKTVSLSQTGRTPINIIVGGSNGYLTKLTI